MKRSEMILKISNMLKILDRTPMMDGNDGKAKAILDNIEALGMYPPYPKRAINPEELDNGWEPEND